MPSDLALPASEQVAPGSTTDVSGISFNDSFAAGNPGDLYLSITDANGELTATDSAGTVPGSGTNSITFDATYADVQAILGSLAYIAPDSNASDTISFDIWDQAGVETTGTIPVAVSNGSTTETWTGAVSSDWNAPGNWSGNAVPVSGDSVTVPPGTPNNATLSNAILNGETITLIGTSTGGSLVKFNDVTLGPGTDLSESSVQLGLGGTVIVGGTLTVDAGAVIEPVGLDGLTLNPATTGGTVVNNGSVINSATGGILWFGSSLVNNGIIAATHGAGRIDIEGLLTNNGTVAIDHSGITLDGSISGGIVAFSGPGGVTAGRPMTFTNGASIAGFSQGDRIGMFGGDVGGSLSFTGSTLDISSASGTLLQAIPMTGSLGLGNFLFRTQAAAKAGSGASVLYAPDGGFANQGTNALDISAPAAVSATQGSTLALNDVSIANATTVTLDIFASSGTLSMNGASGSGTNHLTISSLTPESQINSDLASLTYTPAAGASDATVKVTIDTPVASGGTTEAARYIPISANGSGGGSTVSWTGAANDGQWNTAANWSDNAVPTSGDTVVIAPTTTNLPRLANATLTGETIELDSSPPLARSVFFDNVTLGAGTILESGGSGGSIGDTSTLTVASGATIATVNGAPLGISNIGSAPVTLINDGTITDSGNGGMSLQAMVENHGLIAGNSAAGSQISIGLTGSIVNDGGTIVDAGGLIDFNGVVLGGTVAFTGSGGRLLLGVLNPFAQGAVVTGFGDGDRMLFGAFNPTSMSFSGGTLTLISGSFGEDIPFAGSLGFGNFELNSTDTGANGTPTTTLLFAPSGGPAGTASGEPDISAPGTASVAQGGTLSLNDVSIANVSTLALDITTTSGTLFMNGASGSGTDHLSIAAGTSESQVNADLASLSYVPAAGSTGGTIEVSASAPFSFTGTTDTIRYIPINVAGGNTGPALTEPSSESVTPNSTTSVSGSYADTFAQGNSGDLFLGISDSSGLLSAKDAAGNAVAGSGTNQIALSTDYSDLNAVLGSLTYTAGANTGSDTVNFDIWNQAGVETTGTVAVAIAGGSSGPTLTEPASEAVSTNGTTAVAGSYTDSFAQGNSGQLFLGISDSSGTLTAQDASGQAVAGSGTGSIALSTDYVDLNAILASLHYTSGGSAGSDSIQFQVWNQAGVETTGATAITIGAAASAVAMSPQDLAPAAAAPAVPTDTVPAAGSTAVAMLNDINGAPIGMPLNLNH